MNIKKLPKISLHDHLDGALRPQTIIELAANIGYQLPSEDAAGLRRWFEESANSGSLVDYLKTFDVTTAVMQTREALTRVAHEYVLDLAEDGVIYAEVRWAPEQHLHTGLSLDEVVDAVQDGLDAGIEEVESRGGNKIDASAVKVTYLKATAVDLTPRLKGAITENGIDFAKAEVPPGEHAVKITVKDVDGRESNTVMNLVIGK